MPRVPPACSVFEHRVHVGGPGTHTSHSAAHPCHRGPPRTPRRWPTTVCWIPPGRGRCAPSSALLSGITAAAPGHARKDTASWCTSRESHGLSRLASGEYHVDHSQAIHASDRMRTNPQATAGPRHLSLRGAGRGLQQARCHAGIAYRPCPCERHAAGCACDCVCHCPSGVMCSCL